MNRCLVVYFSRKGENYVQGQIVDLEVGNTEVAANMIHDIVGGTLFKVETIHAYAKNYHECTLEAKKELEHQERPKILDYVHQFSEYDTIFVCFPNWWSTMPMAMFTFLECHDTKGKTIIPLCTHEGSGLGRSVQDIQKACPQAHVLKGLAIQGSRVHESKEVIQCWIDELHI